MAQLHANIFEKQMHLLLKYNLLNVIPAETKRLKDPVTQEAGKIAKERSSVRPRWSHGGSSRCSSSDGVSPAAAAPGARKAGISGSLTLKSNTNNCKIFK